MCGIAGFCLNPLDSARINSRKLAKALMLGIEERGQDATGVAFRTPSGSCPIQIHKADVPASLFTKRMPMPLKAQVGLIHTRFATQGKPQDNSNNHPIFNGGIVGVHNGHVSNDTMLFRLVRDAGGHRYGEVDSEAIFASIAHNVSRWPKVNSEPTLADVLESIAGTAAIAWMSEDDQNDVLHLARINNSPLVISFTPNGSLLFASTAAAIKAAAANVGVDICRTIYAEEGMYYRIQGGAIVETMEFEPMWRSYRSAYTSANLVSLGGVTTMATTATTTEEPPPVSDLADDLVSPLSLTQEYGTAYSEPYAEREKAIGAYKAGLSSAVPAIKNQTVYELHGLLRIGEWVKTTVQNVDAFGQVYEMPQSFPHGHYLLRVMVFNETRPNSVEWVIIARMHQEFTRVTEQMQAPGDVDATKALQAALAEDEQEQAELDAALQRMDDNDREFNDVCARVEAEHATSFVNANHEWQRLEGVWVGDEFVPDVMVNDA